MIVRPSLTRTRAATTIKQAARSFHFGTRSATRSRQLPSQSRRCLSCASVQGPSNTVLLFGGSKAGRRTLQRRLDETSHRAAPSVSNLQLDTVGWTQVQSADACGVQQRQQMDLAMVVVDPLEGLHYDNSNNNSTGEQQHEDPPHLDLAKAGEVGMILSELFRQGHRVSLVFNVREEGAQRWRRAQGGGEGVVAALVRDIQEQALAVALQAGSGAEGNEGSGGLQQWQLEEGVLESLTLDLTAEDAGERVAKHLQRRLAPSRATTTTTAPRLPALGQEDAAGTPLLSAPLLVPPKYSEQGRSVVLVVSPEGSSSRSSQTMLEALTADCREQVIPTLTYPLPLGQALSSDPTTRRSEAKRFFRATQHLAPGSLVIADTPALPLLAAWTRDWRGRSLHDLSSYSLAALHAYGGGLGPFLAGLRAMDRLRPGDRVLVADLCACPTGEDEAVARVSSLLTSHVAARSQQLQPTSHDSPAVLQVEHVAWDSAPPSLSGAAYRLILLRGGCRINRPQQAARLKQLSSSGLPLLTSELLLQRLAASRSSSSSLPARLLQPWPSSRLSLEDERQYLMAAGLIERPNGRHAAPSDALSAAGRRGGVVPEFGFRTASHECGSCESWACSECTRLQHQFYRDCGEHHVGEMGQEWRDASY